MPPPQAPSPMGPPTQSPAPSHSPHSPYQPQLGHMNGPPPHTMSSHLPLGPPSGPLHMGPAPPNQSPTGGQTLPALSPQDIQTYPPMPMGHPQQRQVFIQNIQKIFLSTKAVVWACAVNNT